MFWFFFNSGKLYIACVHFELNSEVLSCCKQDMCMYIYCLPLCVCVGYKLACLSWCYLYVSFLICWGHCIGERCIHCLLSCFYYYFLSWNKYYSNEIALHLIHGLAFLEEIALEVYFCRFEVRMYFSEWPCLIYRHSFCREQNFLWKLLIDYCWLIFVLLGYSPHSSATVVSILT